MSTVVELYETPGNDHGCRGFSVTVQPIIDRLGVVVDGRSCSSCWQVGHSDGDSPVDIGSVVELPEKFEHREVWIDDWQHASIYIREDESGNRFVYGDDIPIIEYPEIETHNRWYWASRQAGHSHNGSVDDYDDPLPDCTLVRPSELRIVGRIEAMAAADALLGKQKGAFARLKAAMGRL